MIEQESIDIRWIPLAKASFVALGQQISFIESHVSRVREKRDRYEGNSIAWAQSNTELRMWEQVLDILKAIHNGRTVQPS